MAIADWAQYTISCKIAGTVVPVMNGHPRDQAKGSLQVAADQR